MGIASTGSDDITVPTPGLSEEEKARLLHCVVVGGGPTGVEFSGELSDFIMRDLRERYAHVKDYVKVTLIEVRIDRLDDPEHNNLHQSDLLMKLPLF